MRQVRDGVRDRRVALLQLVAREQLDAASLLEREEADAIELALEEPVGAGEPLVGEGRRHRDDPFWERCSHPRIVAYRVRIPNPEWRFGLFEDFAELTAEAGDHIAQVEDSAL